VQLLKPEMKAESKTYTYIEPIAPKTIELLTEYLPYCKDLIKKAEAHLNEIGK
jgi:c-di-AMP phosphodiesterase-like protein